MNILTTNSQTHYWANQLSMPNIQLFDRKEAWRQSQGPRLSMIDTLAVPDLDDINDIISHSNHAMIFSPEFISDVWCREFDLPSVTFFLGGHLNWPLRQARATECLYFFWSTCDFYRARPELLVIDGKQTLMFDALLGRRKPHRAYVYNNIDHDQNWVTYYPTDQDLDITQYQDNEFVWPSDVLDRPGQEITLSVQEVTVDGTIVSLSQILPREIYAQTRYSLVTETLTDNGWSFFTEKIVKPMLAKRLFLVASGQHYLRNLRNLGFRTFEGLVDESYDQEPDANLRLEMIMDQVRYLSQQDAGVMQQHIAPILEHNFQVIMHTDWQQRVIDNINQVIQDCLIK